jgi:hypothetical protein
MNNLYKELYTKAVNNCATHADNSAWLWEKEYAKLVIQECINQSSDYLDKARIQKHFGVDIKE